MTENYGYQEMIYMEAKKLDTRKYIYSYACDKNEISLSALEMRSLFGVDTTSQYTAVETTREIDPSRSPFITNRIDVLIEASTVEEVSRQVKRLNTRNATFKVKVIKNRAETDADKIKFSLRRQIEREIGRQIKGQADLDNPEVWYGMMHVNGKWVFGIYHENLAVWFRHKSKPHNYSTALNTRLARAIVNIAVPVPAGIKAIDPCCGIGTVVIEALSMGIDMAASDNNPLIMTEVRENLMHFGFSGDILLRDICEVNEYYDVAVIDLPYNVCSVLPKEKKTEMLRCAREFAGRLVVITTEPVDHLLEEVNFRILDHGEYGKKSFTRKIIVCE